MLIFAILNCQRVESYSDSCLGMILSHGLVEGNIPSGKRLHSELENPPMFIG